MMEVYKTICCILIFLSGLHAYTKDYPEYSWISPMQNVPYGYEEYQKQQLENQYRIMTEERAAGLDAVYRQLRQQTGAVDIEAGIPAEYQYNFTQQCWNDWQRYVFALTNPAYVPFWARRMFDSTGFFDAGILDGNMVFEGRYDECERAQKIPWNEGYDYPVYSMYCIAYWFENFPTYGWLPRGQGMCIPDTCTDDDAKELLRTVFFRGLPWYADLQMRCERGKPELSEDPAAISTIVIYALFCSLVLVSTLYHWCLFNMHKRRKEHQLNITKVEPESASRAPSKEETNGRKTLPEPAPDYDTQLDIPGEVNNGYVAGSKDCAIALQDMKSPRTLNGGAAQISSRALNGTAVQMPVETKNKRSDQNPDISQNKLLQLLLTFSMYVNIPLVTSARQPPGAYGCLNGLRVLAMLAVILGHTFTLGPNAFPQTVENNIVMFSAYAKPVFTKMITMDVYVDTFFILSAFLVTISLLRRLDKADGKLGVSGWVMHYFSRYWRLTPTYMLVLMFAATLWHYLGEGPFMGPYFGDADTCADTWWANLLYINNLYVKDGICFGWSWYLAVDWQLFCAAPIFIYVLWRWKWAGIALTFAGFCGGLTSVIVLKHQYYTQTAEPGDDDYVDDFMDIYIKPWCRCPVYFMGIGLGYLFHRTGGKIKIPCWLVLIGWFVALSMYLLVSYIPALTICDNQDVCGPWSDAENTAFYSLNRVMWGVWVCWVITACSTGYGGFVNTFLSWKFFVPLGKLTYLGYLLHPIFTYLYFYGSPLQQYYNFYFFLYIYAGHLVFVYACALVMSVAVSAPLMGSMAVFLPSMRGKAGR